MDRRISELFQHLEPDVWIEDLTPSQPGITVGVRQGEAFTIRGDAYILLHDIASALALPASKGGPSVKEAESLLLSACTRYLKQGENEALAWLEAKLQAPKTRWTVVKPTTLFQSAPQVVIGTCRLRRGLPFLPQPVPQYIKDVFPAFSISVEVEARDEEGAKLLADLRFADALAVVQLSDPFSVATVGDATLVLSEEGRITFSQFPPGGPSVDHISDRQGNLFSFTKPLADASSRPRSARTEWENRALAATRWLREALATRSSSVSLINQMVALEALFVPKGTYTNKGRVISREVSGRWLLRSMTRRQQEDWIEDLYKRRNEIAHEAGTFRNEIEVDRLMELTWQSTIWGARHLSPYHRPSERVCRTQAEALSCR